MNARKPSRKGVRNKYWFARRKKNMPGKNMLVLSRKKAALFLILVILVFGAYTLVTWPRCSELQEIPASVEVRTVPGRAFMGFNTDTDSLKFEGVSPNAEVVRSMNVQYPFDAEVLL